MEDGRNRELIKEQEGGEDRGKREEERWEEWMKGNTLAGSIQKNMHLNQFYLVHTIQLLSSIQYTSSTVTQFYLVHTIHCSIQCISSSYSVLFSAHHPLLLSSIQCTSTVLFSAHHPLLLSSIQCTPSTVSSIQCISTVTQFYLVHTIYCYSHDV